MRAIKRILIILLVLMTGGYIFTAIYQGSADRKVAPVISCPEGVLEVSASDPESALLQGVTAFDEQDGDLTNRVILGGVSKLISNDTAKVTLLVFDSDDNMGKYTRYIRYTDYRLPRFSIDEPLIYSTTEDVSILERISAYDVVDGNLNEAIRVSTLEGSSDSRRYTIAVQVTNSLGDTASLELPVLLLDTDALRPTVTLNEYLLYLKTDSQFDPAALLAGVEDPAGIANLDDVQIESNVDTSVAGTYQIVYTYVSGDHIGTAIATVVVQ